MVTRTPNTYRGRFAPSPTGPLHLGSLVAALASYLDAKSNHGSWLVRIEDIDPPREQPGAAASILETLEAHGLQSDEKVVFQSQRLARYHQIIEELIKSGRAYPCICSRQQLANHPVYPGTCATGIAAHGERAVVRIRTNNARIRVNDLIQGPKHAKMDLDIGDFVIRRKEGLVAYQLAVALDDHWQSISRVVRGYDLLDSTFRQVFILQQLGLTIPEYAHIPVVSDRNRQKLSKQNNAPPLDNAQAKTNLCQALRLLGLSLPKGLELEPVDAIISWGVTNWNISGILAKEMHIIR